jgi:predicted phosphate transport protein (TIGR00153 family)
MGKALFGRSKAVERKIDAFLDKVSEAALVVVAEIQASLEPDGVGLEEQQRRRSQQILELKKECSRLRREIESDLYTERLIPDLLGDVASLVESLYGLVEDMHHAMVFIRPGHLELPDFVRTDGKELAAAGGHAIEQLVQAARAFFRDFTHVRDHVHKVAFYESESDAARDRLLDKIYATDLGLAEKDHLARAVRELDAVADRAERIADTLTIYAIKRSD